MQPSPSSLARVDCVMNSGTNFLRSESMSMAWVPLVMTGSLTEGVTSAEVNTIRYRYVQARGRGDIPSVLTLAFYSETSG